MIYCDNAATTKIFEEVFNVMLPYLKNNYGNASSLYSIGYKNKKAIEKAREQVATAINALPEEIFFTSGATESNNWVFKGIKFSSPGRIITTSFEHPSVLNSCKRLARDNEIIITYLNPDSKGVISVSDVTKHLRCNTNLVSVMTVNNEIGTIQPVKQIGEICKANDVLFHTDATQAMGHMEIDVKDLNIDLMSFSGHKFHAPKGIGVLYICKDIQNRISPLIDGGMQESGFRAGTENVANIVGLGKAIEIAKQNLSQQDKIRAKSEKLLKLLLTIDGVSLNGSLDNRIANILNIHVRDCESESLVIMLDTEGLCVSSGSACHGNGLNPSNTLKAIGLTDKQAFESIRISLDESISDNEILEIYKIIKKCVDRLR
jgi:cysteine desulfurase